MKELRRSERIFSERHSANRQSQIVDALRFAICDLPYYVY